MKKLLVLSAALCIHGLIQAQGFNYQAVARDANGAVLSDQTLQVEIAIYDGALSDIPTFNELHEVRTNEYGLFTLVIGEGMVQSRPFTDLRWDVPGRTLGVKIDVGGGFTDMGRTPLQGVPYSRFANVAEKVTQAQLSELTDVQLTGLSDGQVLKWNAATQSWQPANDNVATGTGASVNTAARLTGDGSQNTPLDIARQGAQNGQVLTWQGSSWQPATPPGTSYQAGTGIAIQGNTISNTGLTSNTDAGGDLSGKYPNPLVTRLQGRLLSNTAPSNGQVLAWNGSTQRWQPATINFPSLQAGNGIAIQGNTIINTGITENTNAGGDLSGRYPNPTVLRLRGRLVGSAAPERGQVLGWSGTEWAPIDPAGGSSPWSLAGNNVFYNSGNVGIGLNNPAYLAHLRGSSPSLMIENTATSPIFLRFKRANDGVNDHYIALGSNGNMFFRVGGNDRMTIDNNNGNIGMGTATPIERLDVNGGVKIGNTTSTNAGTIRWTGTDFQGRKGNEWVSLTEGGGSSLWTQSGSHIHYIGGRIGVGITDPAYLAHLRGSTPALMIESTGNTNPFLRFKRANDGVNDNYIALGSTGNMFLRVGGTDRMTIAGNNGNVGIGTTNPGNRLQVNGDVQVSGKVKRTATGNANMVAIAYGHIDTNGAILNGSGNFTTRKLGPGHYQVDIQGESLSAQNYTAVISARGSAPSIVTWGIADFNLVVFTHNTLGIRTDNIFSFVLYKP
ncbi:MAG TPA: hypothetical protein PKC76_13400 [Saprospiraceae bacterium]|nr:hypothetical protein [Saprospiraceae bacterium]HMP25129.1 hypothetical protein [Saprospiraceae bacterium]